jgi:integrase/recombinase XerD
MPENIAQLHEEFIRERRYVVGFREATLKGYQDTFRVFLKLMPEITIKTLCKDTMLEFFKRLDTRERIVGRGYVKKGVKPSTLATYRTSLFGFFKWLMDLKKLDNNPFDNIPYPKVVYDDIKYLKKEEVKKIITAIDFGINWINQFVRKRNMAMIIILLCCGLRKNELVSLETTDIDLDRKILKVRAETSKSKRDRVIPFNDLVKDKLKDYLNERKLEKKEYTTSSLFASNTRDAGLTKDGFDHFIADLVEKSGVKFHAHRFRHTYAVNLVMGGTDIAKVKELLGHVDIKMTAKYLRYLPTQKMRADVEKLTPDNLV